MLEYDRETNHRRDQRRAIAISILENDPLRFETMSADLRGDAEVALAAVNHDGNLLDFVSDELKGDAAVVFAATRQTRNGFTFEIGSKSLKNDRQVMLDAVEQRLNKMKFA